MSAGGGYYMDDICKVCFDANGGTGLMPDFVFSVCP